MRKEISAISIYSDEPYIPWEVFRPSDEEGIDDLFFCEQHLFSRWLFGAPYPKPKDKLINVKLVIPDKLNLKNVYNERDEIRNLSTVEKFNVSVDKTNDDFMNSLENGGFDILHISSHGKANFSDPDLSEIYLEENEKANSVRSHHTNGYQ